MKETGMATYTVTHLNRKGKRICYNSFNNLFSTHNTAKKLSEATDGVQVRSSWPDSLGLVAEYKVGRFVSVREATKKDNENSPGYEWCGAGRR